MTRVDQLDFRQIVFSLRANDSLPRCLHPVGSLAHEIERLIDISNGIDVARIRLTRAQIFVLKKKIGIGSQTRLSLKTARNRDTLVFRFERSPRLDRLLDCVVEAERGPRG